ncbi:unnamed protein product [Microthlaspi erraticum]|uniref:FBD domain-containing protein n=1 Tax=Microthlaspi erraticum TaxID=1685480 RepID=A0A6D2JJP9_9BRAS|nr:unnamed protein product [Microthlaspi erraticum]
MSHTFFSPPYYRSLRPIIRRRIKSTGFVSVMSGRDRISELPEHLITQILSYLPTKDSVKTSVLATGWKSHWLNVPGLDLNCSNFPHEEDEVILSFLDRFLDSNSESRLSKVKVKPSGLEINGLTDRIGTAVSLGAQHLDVESSVFYRDADTLEYPIVEFMPLSLCTSKTLESLKLRYSGLRDPGVVSMPRLRSMELLGVYWQDTMNVEKLVSGCPVLEELTLVRDMESNFQDEDVVFMRVRSRSLKRFYVPKHGTCGGISWVKSTLEIDAPCLEYMSLKEDHFDKIVVKNLTSLLKVDLDIKFVVKYGVFLDPEDFLLKRKEVSDFLAGISSAFEIYSKGGLVPKFNNLSCLQAVFPSDLLQFLPSFLESFPNLKHLILKVVFLREKDEFELIDVPRCLLSTLECVEIRTVHEWEEDEMKVASYFLENAAVLEKFFLSLTDYPRYLADSEIGEELEKVSKRSPTCRIILDQEFCCHGLLVSLSQTCSRHSRCSRKVAMYSRDELDDMEYRYYSDMKDGYREVKISDSVFRCPFCYRDRKRDYHRIEELLRHASSVIDYSSSRSKDAIEKVRHLALERYIRKYLISPSPQEGPDPTVVAGDLKGVEKQSISPCIVKAEPMSVDDVPGRIGEERPMLSLKASNEDNTNPAKKACLGAVVKEEEEPVQRKLAPKYPQRDDFLGGGVQGPKFVHPWTGILANIKRTFNVQQGRYVGESGTKIKEELIRNEFNPHKVEPLWNQRVGNTGFAFVHFGKGWEGYENATMFDKHFEVNHCGKRDYDAARERGDKLYGWIAKEDDFYSRGIIGDHLRKKADLKSVSGKELEDHNKTLTLVSKLENTLETKSSSLQQIESKYEEASTALDKVMIEKDDMINKHNEQMSSIHQSARDYLASVYQKHEEASRVLEAQRIEYEEKEKYLEKCQAMNKTERRKLQWQKQKNLMATKEQHKADEDMMRLAEQHQRDKDVLRKKVRELEQKLDAEQALELEIERMRGDLQVMGHMQEGEDPEKKEHIEKEIEKAKEILKEKVEESEFQESIYQTLVVKHGYTNDELQDARKALIKSMQVLGGVLRTEELTIGVKRMGLLDDEPFQNLAKEKYPAEEADVKAAELCSLWDDHLRDSAWHPTKVIIKDGNPEEILNEEDEKVKELKRDLGEEVFEAVIQAFKERNEYNGSGRYIVPEVWNFKEGRKATLREGVACLVYLWAKLKPKPKRKLKR